MPYQISIELYPADGTVWRFDSYKDGPIGEWLETVVSKLGRDMASLTHNATIRVWERKQ